MTQMIDLPFRPDRASRAPVYRQLADCVRGLIEAARLGSGQKLPATRELAAALGLSRTTVAQAYDDLIAAGLLTAHVGQGTFVASHVLAPPGAHPRSGRAFVWPGLFAARTRALSVPSGLIPTALVRYDFRGGRVDPSLLPAGVLRRACAEALASGFDEIVTHQDPRGWPPLRQEVAHYLIARGIACQPDDVVIVSGAQQAIDLAARVLLDPGDTVVMEQPGYFGAAMAFTSSEAQIVGVGVDAEGLRADELARVLQARRVKLIYATPAVQNPTGVSISAARRQQILALVDEHQAPLFEDDYGSELRYGTAPLTALKTADTAGQVIYAGTFSKMLFPSLRVGYVVAAEAVLGKIALARASSDFGTSVLPQVVAAGLLRSGALDRHVRRLRRLYGERRRAMGEALARAMPAGTRWTEPGGGYLMWVTLPPGVDGHAVWRAAGAAGIAYSSGTAFHVDGRGSEHLALSFACMPAARIAEGVERLAAIVRRHAGEKTRAHPLRPGSGRASRRPRALRDGPPGPPQEGPPQGERNNQPLVLRSRRLAAASRRTPSRP